MRVHLFSALAALKIGMDILFEEEQVKIDQVLGHGGFFKTEEVGQKIMAAAMNVPVSVMETAGRRRRMGNRIACLPICSVSKRMNLWKPISPTRSLPRRKSTTIAPDQRMLMALRPS